MLDYRQWVLQLEGFVNDLQKRSPAHQQANFKVQIAPSLTPDELAQIKRDFLIPLPTPLLSFLGHGSGRVSFQFSWYNDHGEKLEAGETFCPAPELAFWRECCVDFAKNSWLMEEEWPLDRAFWRHAIQITRYANHDGLALWMHDYDHMNPAVTFLKHDDASFLLAPTLESFLTHWARLAYHPIAGLEEFRNPESGFLDSTLPQSLAYRKKFGLKD